MKQNIYIAALLAGMLALAGCGGGSGSTAEAPDPLAEANAKIAELEGKDNRTQAQKDAEKKTICEAAGGMLDTAGECGPDNSAAEAMKAAADAATLHGLLTAAGAYQSAGFTPGAAQAGFATAKDADKGHEMITVDGPKLMLTNGVLSISGMLDKATSDMFGTLDTITHERSTTNGMLQPARVSGKYDGISGEFSCSGNNPCTSQNGHPVGGIWTFNPDNDEEKTKTDYKWGWWVTRSSTTDAISAVNFFRNLAGAVTDARLGAEGTATYEGDAVGLYSVPNDSGGFTANASLTATFKGSSTAASLEGTIDGFKGADGEDRNWSVKLSSADGDSNDQAFQGGTVWTLNGIKGTERANHWNADSYGGTADKTPAAIMGDFKALHQGAAMIGVFGTEKQ